MANTITKSTDGNIAFEDFESGTSGDAYTGDFLTSGTLEFDNTRAYRGNNSLKVVTGGGWDAFYKNLGADIDKVCLSTRIYMSASNPQCSLYIGDAALNDTGKRTVTYRPYDATPDLYKTMGITLDLRNSGVYPAAEWVLLKVFWDNAASIHEYSLFAQDNTCIQNYLEKVGANLFNITRDHVGLRLIFGNSKLWVDDVAIMADNIVHFAGVVSGMHIAITDASDNAIHTVRFTGTTGSIDFNLKPLPLMGHKIKVYGTDGGLLLTETPVNILGGDTWTYSGDTSTAGGRVRSIRGGY